MELHKKLNIIRHDYVGLQNKVHEYDRVLDPSFTNSLITYDIKL
jgi:hypothetical protein